MNDDLDILQSYLDGDLPADEAIRLEARLKSEPELADRLAALAREEAILHEWARSTRTEPGRLHTPRAVPACAKFRAVRAAALAACVLIAILGLAWLLPIPNLTLPTQTSSLQLAEGVKASPDAIVREIGPDRLELVRGELLVHRSAEQTPLEVKTSAGTASGNQFFIDVREPQGDEEMRLARTMVYVTVLAGLVSLTNTQGEVTGTAGEALYAADAKAPVKQVEDLALRFAQYYEPVKTAGVAKIPSYPLPLDTDKVSNLKDVSLRLGLQADEPALKKNGFVVLNGKGNEDIVAPYSDLKKRRVPIFITVDTLLHLYHVQFDETLKDIEEREFYPDMVKLTTALTADLAAQPIPAGADFQEARKKALTYLAVGLKSLSPDAPLPKGVSAQDVDIVLDKMKKHEGFWPDPNKAASEWPLFRYAEDFSQYVPRGHYTRSEELKKYFVGMMWFGRLSFLLKGDPSFGPSDQHKALVSVAEARQQTLAASLLTRALAQTKLKDGRTAREVWERIYVVTSFYVGLADDLGLQEYQTALEKVCGASLDLAKLNNAKGINRLKLELARFQAPAIYSGTGAQSIFIDLNPDAGVEELDKALAKTAGFRLMGQRFIPDSYMMGKLVFPTVGAGTNPQAFTAVQTDLGLIRGFPRGLDVLGLLGSKRARTLISELGDDAYVAKGRALGYPQAFDKLHKEFAGLSDKDWNRNLYWSWLYSLKPLVKEYGAGYPTFMTTEAYRTKSLNTALASWAQLRHDTILYAKQSYTITAVTTSVSPIQVKPVQGYVEPAPEFYARMLALSRMTSKGLGAMKVLDKPAKARLAAFEEILARLLAISEKELAFQELTEADYAFIRNFGDRLEHVVVTQDKPKPGVRPKFGGENKAMKTTLIADVHTDQNTGKVLEEGTGYVDLGLFVYRQPDGRLVVGAGPVLSYYEFKHPMKDRLTDEKWRDMLKSDKAPAQPIWTKAYRSEKGSYRAR